MRDLDSLSASQLLSVTTPERLFSGNLNDARQEYRSLVHRWHPDIATSKEAALVFAHISELYKQAQEHICARKWKEPAQRVEEEQPGVKKYRHSRSGSTHTYEYTVARPFELGTVFLSAHYVLFEVSRDFDDLFGAGLKQLGALGFRNESMAVEMSRYLPQVLDSYEAVESNILVVRKTPDQVLLADLLTHFGGRLEQAEHAGWILNVIFNLACYFEWAGISHNAISAETMFVSPLRHSGMLLGGWWYSAPIGGDLVAVPEYLLNFVPPDVIRDKRADGRTDLELIKALGRRLFGDISGGLLPFDLTVPDPMKRWLQLPSSGQALTDYAEWKYSVLPECFGEARFVRMDVEPAHLYKEK